MKSFDEIEAEKWYLEQQNKKHIDKKEKICKHCNSRRVGEKLHQTCVECFKIFDQYNWNEYSIHN